VCPVRRAAREPHPDEEQNLVAGVGDRVERLSARIAALPVNPAAVPLSAARAALPRSAAVTAVLDSAMSRGGYCTRCAEPSPRRAARPARSMRMNRSRGFIRSERRRPMPEKATMERVREDKREGKAPSTQAGEFVREEMDHIREGKHGARSTKQAIAIGLSKARRAGVGLRAPAKGTTSSKTRRSAQSALRAGRSGRKPSARRSRATHAALRREGRAAASRSALASQARTSARRRGPRARKVAAARAVRTKGPQRRRASARKAARTRARSTR
jgi:hypothetical protein